MSGDAGRWADRSYLRDVQYRTDANLAARQSMYAYQHPRLDLAAAVLGLGGLHGEETVADVGCGNGAYLAELAARGHAGPVLGMDMSPTRGRRCGSCAASPAAAAG
jgi:cyclopropane fatty-acyl-phospholipid synthase-like methyltransferase